MRLICPVSNYMQYNLYFGDVVGYDMPETYTWFTIEEAMLSTESLDYSIHFNITDYSINTK